MGLGYAVPSQVRLNDDPIFDWLHQNTPPGKNLFDGYDERRVLGPDEDLMSIMVPAAQQALSNAGIDVEEIDLLLGTGSISAYRNPNALSQLHDKLGLPKRAWAIPIDSDFSNYNACLCLADAMIRAGRANNVLICVGGNWTRNVNYHTSQAISAADGAGAAVMRMSDDDDKWTLVDTHTIMATEYYGSMFTDSDLLTVSPPQDGYSPLWTDHYFHITPEGIQGFVNFGEKVTPMAAVELMKRHGLSGDEVTLISHQASTVLMDAWSALIQPAQYIQTIQKFANTALANVSINMAWAEQNEPVLKNNLILLAMGPDMHANALLFRRGR